MLRRGCILALLAAFSFASLAASPAPTATPEQIDQALDAGKKFLYNSMLPSGRWDETYVLPKDQDGGVTCMCLYALLGTGESEKDPRLAKAINFAINSDLQGTYAMTFQALALSKLKMTQGVKSALSRIYLKLLQGGERPGAGLGLYTYSCPKAGESWDHSNSQYGPLGIWACGDAGIEIPDRYWDEVEKAWRATQNKDGGWDYSPGDPHGSTGNMTAAGVATMFMADDALSFRLVDCKGNPSNPSIEKGLDWLSAKMRDQTIYEWYGIGRIGISSGYKYIGDYDWFKGGAAALLAQQKPDGSWHEYTPTIGTSYAILFLYRGKAPVVMNKLRYEKDGSAAGSPDGNWNERNRDAANVAKYMGEQLETFLNWQVVTLAVDPDELHDAPILYISGNLPLKFSPAEIAALKRFVEDGGMLLGNADCGAPAFSASFKELAGAVTDGKYEFRNLPADHPIFTREQFLLSSWKSKPTLMGLSNGVRELAILIPTADPARAWQVQAFLSKKESFQLASDIVLYSTDKQHLNAKGVTYIVKPDASITASATIKIARLQYAGNWDPEPGGWRRLTAVMHNQDKTDLAVTTVALGKGDLTGYPIAHLTGTGTFTLTDEQRSQLKKFVEGGGTLVIDAAGGSTAFADAAGKELAQIFGADAARQLDATIPQGDAIYGEGETAVRTISYRDMARKMIGIGNAPRIRGIQVNGRWGVLFSREDLSGGLVGEQVDGIVGYSPDTATALMRNMLLSAARQPAASQPAK